MRKMTILDRVLLLVTGILAGYQVAVGIARLSFAFLRAGKPIFSTTTFFKFLPALLMLVTLSFVIGMELG